MTVPTSAAAETEGLHWSTWIVPDLGDDDSVARGLAALNSDVSRLASLLISHHRQGGEVVASGSAVLLLESIGLLSATDPEIQETTDSGAKTPQGKHSPRAIVVQGAFTTCKNAYAQLDLLIHLLRRSCGTRTAEAALRHLLPGGWRDQIDAVIPGVMAHGDALVDKIVSRIGDALPNAPLITDLAREFCVSPRTLSRYVHKTTGKSTFALVQSVRLRHARALLERSRMSIEQVAAAVGYSDSTALRRLMMRSAGVLPSELRPTKANHLT
ncbi:helix-turn-helix domain-containing protein [Rhizobacter sp. Root404]|uniref:helix-turn-helix domain-containing protein n=1 Tax=Rhizobacter sp. Root404 TaxID=1736528 RepID=UPI00138EF622|nr:helix-turn-helix domain-containing protein [Rhizobacter sp. Root404]